jgi:hypothetical protein
VDVTSSRLVESSRQVVWYMPMNKCIVINAHNDSVRTIRSTTEPSMGKASMKATTTARRLSKRLMVRSGLKARSARSACRQAFLSHCWHDSLQDSPTNEPLNTRRNAQIVLAPSPGFKMFGSFQHEHQTLAPHSNSLVTEALLFSPMFLSHHNTSSVVQMQKKAVSSQRAHILSTEIGVPAP